MKLGIISDLRNPQHPRFHRPWVHHYHAFLDLIVQLEDLGFEEVVFPEHHFEPDGYLPNPIPLMTAVAMQTKRMLVGADLFRQLQHRLELFAKRQRVGRRRGAQS